MGLWREIKKLGRAIDDAIFQPIVGALVPNFPEASDVPSPQGSELRRDPTDKPLNVIIGEATRYPITTAVFEDVVDPNDGDDIKNDLYLAWYAIGEPVRWISQVYVDDVAIDDARYTAEGQHIISSTSGAAFVDGINGNINVGQWLKKTRFDQTKHRFTNIAVLYFFANWHPEKFSSLGRLSADIKGYPLKGIHGEPVTNTDDYSCFAHAIAELITNDIWGNGDARSTIDIASFTYASEVYRQPVPRHEQTTETEVLHRCDTIIDTTKPVLSHLKTLLTGCLSYLVYRDGKHYLIPQTHAESVDFLLSDGSQGTPHRILEHSAIRSGNTNNRYNQVEVKYRDYRTGKTQSVFYPRTDSQDYQDLRAEDGGKKLNKTFTLHTCNRPTEALRYARHQLLKSRHNLAFSVDCRADCISLEIGDVVPVTIATVGFDQKPFRIVGRALEDGFVVLDLEEYQDTFFDWKNENPPEIPDTILQNPFDVTAPSDLRSEVIDDGGIHFTWFSEHQHFEILIEKDGQRLHAEQIVTHDYRLTRALSAGYYVFKVRANNEFYWSPFVAYTFRLSVPTAPTITVLSASTDTIILQAATDGQGKDTRFEFQYRGTDGNFEGAVVETNPFTAGALQHNQQYHFRVRSKNPVGTSDWSSITASTTEISRQMADVVADFTQVTQAALDRAAKLEVASINHEQVLTEIQQFLGERPTLSGSPIFNLDNLAALAETGSFELAQARLNAELGQVKSHYAKVTFVSATVDTAVAGMQETLAVEVGDIKANYATTALLKVSVDKAMAIAASELTAATNTAKTLYATKTELTSTVDAAKATAAKQLKAATDNAAATYATQAKLKTDLESTEASLKSVLRVERQQALASYAKTSELDATTNSMKWAIRDSFNTQFGTNYAKWNDALIGGVRRNKANIAKVSALAAKVLNEDGSFKRAGIAQIQNVMANDDNGAIADHITEYTVSHAGKKVSIKTLAGAAISPDGNTFASQFGAFENLRDLKNGFGFFRKNNDTKIVASAQKLHFYDSDNQVLGNPPFRIEKGITQAKAVVANSIITKNLQAGAVTETVFFYDGKERTLSPINDNARAELSLFHITFDANRFVKGDRIVINQIYAHIECTRGANIKERTDSSYYASGARANPILGVLYLHKLGRRWMVSQDAAQLNRQGDSRLWDIFLDVRLGSVVISEPETLFFEFVLIANLKTVDWGQLKFRQGSFFARGVKR